MTDQGGLDAPGSRRRTETPRSGTRPSAAIGPGISGRLSRHRPQRPWKWERSWKTLVDGQGKRKPGSDAIILRLNFASMALDDRPNDGETHSQTFRFSGEKLIEHLVANLG